MLQCPSCSTPLSLADCKAGCCSPVKSGCRRWVTPSPPQDTTPFKMMSGGLIQYPNPAPLAKSFSSHLYQNTGPSLQISDKSDTVSTEKGIQHDGPCVQTRDSGKKNIGSCVQSTGPCDQMMGSNTQNKGPSDLNPTCGSTNGLTQPPSVGTGLSSREEATDSRRAFVAALQEGRKLQQEEIAISEHWLQLHIQVLQNQLQQSRLQQEMLRSNCIADSSVTSSPFINSIQTPSVLVGEVGRSPFFPSPHETASTSIFTPLTNTLFSHPPKVPCPPLLTNDRHPHTSASILTACRQQLKQSGWYYGSLSWQASSSLLANTSPGTFLVRDSQHPGCHFSLSVQRSREGPTSIRIQFVAGKFFLDAEERIRDAMPRFSSVGELVQHYLSREGGGNNEDSSSPSPIVLQRPLRSSPPSLAHSSRLVINKHLQLAAKGNKTGQLGSLELPSKLVDFLDNYPLSI